MEDHHDEPKWFKSFRKDKYGPLEERVDKLIRTVDKVVLNLTWIKWLLAIFIAVEVGGKFMA